jgi:hypothetical protein
VRRHHYVLGILLLVTGCSTLESREPQDVVVSGAGIQRALSGADGKLRTKTILNEIAKRELAISGPEFVLTWGQGDTVTSDDFDLVSIEKTTDGALACLKNTELGLAAEVNYRGGPGRSWLTKQIRFINVGTAPFLLRTIELEHIKVNGEDITYAVNRDGGKVSPELRARLEKARREYDIGLRILQGYTDVSADHGFPRLGDWGQPVYTESLWFGVEFPATRSSATPDGVIFLRHHPGTELKPGSEYVTKRAVLGAAAAGGVKQAFFDYVATLAPRHEVPALHFYWNGFRVIKPPDRAGQALQALKYLERLKNDTGFTFDAFTFDAAYEMYRPDGLFVPAEEGVWEKTAKALEPLGTKLGFWTSFSCIYCVRTYAWGKTQGYEFQEGDKSYCLAGPKYFAAIKKRLEDIARDHNMGSVNFDGMYWGQGYGCNRPGHDHLVGEGTEIGVFATEKVVEKQFEIWRSLRSINPDIILDNFICGEWASPWWLMQLDGVHTVFGDTVGSGIPSPWLRDELITARDIEVFEERKLGRQFPLWAEDLYGTQVRRDHLIDGITVTGESMAERWEDEYVMALPGRGSINNNIVVSDLEVLDGSRGGLTFLAKVAQWTEANQGIYADYRLLGGVPHERELYGYSHADGEGRAVVALRNPSITRGSFALTMDGALGMSSCEEKIYVNVIYPYRRTYDPVRFGETVQVPVEDFQVLLLDVRTESRQFEAVRFAGRWGVNDAGRIILYDESPLASLPAGVLAVMSEDGVVTIAGTVSVPRTAAKGQLQIMFNNPARGVAIEKPTVRVDGKEVVGDYHKRVANKAESWAHAELPSSWFLVDLGPGQHEVEVTVKKTGPETVEIGAWLVGSYVLQGRVTGRTIDAAPLFPVFAEEEDRRAVEVLTPRVCRLR